VRLTKHHGLGNDFLVLGDPSGTRPASAALAVSACDRHRGIGADGLLHLGPGRDGADVSMVLYNADGGRAEMSGNGLGCLAQAAVVSGAAAPPVVSVTTDAGRRTVDIRRSESPRTHVATMSMGPATMGDDEPEWTGGEILRAARVSMGNPHLVLHVADESVLDDRGLVEALGRRANAAIAEGINVELIAVTDDGVAMDVYERGVGLTLACGTGACAAAAAAQRWGLAGARVSVAMRGGATMIDLAGSEIRMTTPITFIGSIDYPWP
jgi:diaminopimelate epimerase